MSLPRLSTRREELARQISQQRHDLAEAYRDLGRPLKYTQTGIKGVQILHQNAWLIGLAPTAVSLVFSFLGWKKEKMRPNLFGFWKKKVSPARKVAAAVSEEAEKKGALPLLRQIVGHSMTALKLYRRFRPYLPL